MATVLLMWTAADLAFPQCCLSYAASASEIASVGANTTSSTGGITFDVDDCFCCAVCVDTGVRIPSLAQPLAAVRFVEPIRHLASRSATLDHPPQNL